LTHVLPYYRGLYYRGIALDPIDSLLIMMRFAVRGNPLLF